MIISFTQRRVLHWAGSGLALIGVLFVGSRLHSYWLELDLSRTTPMFWAFIAGLSIIYGMANLLLAKAWWHLLHYFCLPISLLESIKIYGTSQLAKYVPGNIFHLAGRQVLGVSAGLAPGALAKSTAWELGLIVIAGAQFIWLTLPILASHLLQSLNLLLLLGSALLTYSILKDIFGRHVAFSFLWQVFFMLVSGAIFITLVIFISGSKDLTVWDWLTIGGAYIIAWIVGFVTPGAPAGLGVREFILFLILKGVVSETDLLMALVLCRLVNVTGDLIFFLGTTAVQKNSQTYSKFKK